MLSKPLANGMQPPHPGLDALDDGFCMLDADWRITYWNPAAERLLGVRRDDALGAVLWERLPFLRDSATARHLEAVRRHRMPCRFLDGRPPGGVPGHVSVYAAPLDNGGIAAHFRDATEEVARAEQYAALLESIRDGFVAVDASWRIVYLNGTAESLLHLPRERALGASIWSLLPRRPAEIGEYLRATGEDGAQRHLREVRPEGRVFRGRVFDVWMYPLAGGGVSILFEDVGDRVRQVAELARLAEEAQDANESKGRFFAAISHELRTPLNAIVGYTHLLQSGTYGSMPPAAHRAADRASVCAEHLSRLVDDVLLITTTEVGRLPVAPSSIALPAFLEAVCEPYRHQAEAKGLRLAVDAPADLPLVETDRERLRQLLAALLTNAVKYTSRGEVRVSARLAAGAREPWMEIRVRDTGPGIAPEDRERIFGPFEQIGDPSRSQSMVRGTGLGLAIAQRLAGLLHGDLRLASTSPDGSEFCLRLPVSPPPPEG